MDDERDMSYQMRQINGGGDTCGEHRLRVAVLDRLIGAKP